MPNEVALEKYKPEPEYQAKIDAVKKTFKAQAKAGLAALSGEFKELKKQKQAIEDRLKEHNLKLEAIEQLMLKAFEDEEITKVTIEGGGTLFKKSTAYPKVADKKKLFDWIKRNKMVALLSVNHQTLKSLVNERLREGEDLPSGVDAFLKDSVGHRGLLSGGDDD